MAVFAGLAGMVGRFAGRLLNSTLGWATVLLFGKVTGRKQTILLGISLGAVVWVLLLVGVVVPSAGTFLLGFVPVPPFISQDLVRLAMLGGAIALPLVIGVATLMVTDAVRRPRGPGLVLAVLRGYPFATLLAITIVVLAAVGTVRKVRSLVRGWEDAHVPVVVKPGGYDEVLDQLEGVLRTDTADVRRAPAPWVLSAPPRMLAKVAGSGIDALVPERLTVFRADDLEALVYPSDIAISGTKLAVAGARARIAAQLTHAPVYLTTSADSEKVEDELRGIADNAGVPTTARDRLAHVDQRLQELTVPFEDWDTVYRERLQVERDLLARGGPPSAGAGLDAIPMERRLADRAADRVLAAAVLAATLVDIGLIIVGRVRKGASQ